MWLSLAERGLRLRDHRPGSSRGEVIVRFMTLERQPLGESSDGSGVNRCRSLQEAKSEISQRRRVRIFRGEFIFDRFAMNY